MQKANLILLVLAIVALVATGVGVAASDRWTGEHTVTFATSETDLLAQGPTSAAGSGASFEWFVPDNATSTRLQVAVAFTGQAVQGGSATVTVQVEAPDGHFTTKTVALVVASGATSASTKVDVEVAWAEVPTTVRDGRDAQPAGLHWEKPLHVLVVASPPSDLPVASYAFAASVTGTVTNYHAD